MRSFQALLLLASTVCSASVQKGDPAEEVTSSLSKDQQWAVLFAKEDLTAKEAEDQLTAPGSEERFYQDGSLCGPLFYLKNLPIIKRLLIELDKDFQYSEHPNLYACLSHPMIAPRLVDVAEKTSHEEAQAVKELLAKQLYVALKNDSDLAPSVACEAITPQLLESWKCLDWFNVEALIDTYDLLTIMDACVKLEEAEACSKDAALLMKVIPWLPLSGAILDWIVDQDRIDSVGFLKSLGSSARVPTPSNLNAALYKHKFELVTYWSQKYLVFPSPVMFIDLVRTDCPQMLSSLLTEMKTKALNLFVDAAETAALAAIGNRDGKSLKTIIDTGFDWQNDAFIFKAVRILFVDLSGDADLVIQSYMDLTGNDLKITESMILASIQKFDVDFGVHLVTNHVKYQFSIDTSLLQKVQSITLGNVGIYTSLLAASQESVLSQLEASFGYSNDCSVSSYLVFCGKAIQTGNLSGLAFATFRRPDEWTREKVLELAIAQDKPDYVQYLLRLLNRKFSCADLDRCLLPSSAKKNILRWAMNNSRLREPGLDLIESLNNYESIPTEDWSLMIGERDYHRLVDEPELPVGQIVKSRAGFIPALEAAVKHRNRYQADRLVEHFKPTTFEDIRNAMQNLPYKQKLRLNALDHLLARDDLYEGGDQAQYRNLHYDMRHGSTYEEILRASNLFP